MGLNILTLLKGKQKDLSSIATSQVNKTPPGTPGLHDCVEYICAHLSVLGWVKGGLGNSLLRSISPEDQGPSTMSHFAMFNQNS